MTWTLASSSLDNGAGNRACWATDLSRFNGVGVSSGATAPIVWSDNGTVWTAATGLAAADSFQDIVRSVVLGLHIGVCQHVSTNRPGIYKSTDGKAWTASTIPTAWNVANGEGTAVACKQSSGLVMLAAANVTTAILTTTDGTSFTSHASPFDGGVVAGITHTIGTVSSPADRWIAGGSDSSGNGLVAYSDNDGSTWTTISTAPFTAPVPIGFGPIPYCDDSRNLYLLGVTDGGKTVARSTNNGATWTEIASGLDGGYAQAMVSAGAALLLGGADVTGTKEMCVSWDAGITWAFDETPSPFGSSSANGLAYSPTIPLAVGVGNTLMASAVAYGLPTPPPATSLSLTPASCGGTLTITPVTCAPLTATPIMCGTLTATPVSC